MFAFLQRSVDDGIETFYSNICISIARPRMERRRGLERNDLRWARAGD